MWLLVLAATTGLRGSAPGTPSPTGPQSHLLLGAARFGFGVCLQGMLRNRGQDLGISWAWEAKVVYFKATIEASVLRRGLKGALCALPARSPSRCLSSIFVSLFARLNSGERYWSCSPDSRCVCVCSTEGTL